MICEKEFLGLLEMIACALRLKPLDLFGVLTSHVLILRNVIPVVRVELIYVESSQ